MSEEDKLKIRNRELDANNRLLLKQLQEQKENVRILNKSLVEAKNKVSRAIYLLDKFKPYVKDIDIEYRKIYLEAISTLEDIR